MGNTIVSQEDKVITVLHLDYDKTPRNLLFSATTTGEIRAVVELYNLGLYDKVATVLTHDLDHAFSLTQNIDNNWVHNKKVQPIEDAKGYRSTSVGDILVLDNEVFVVAAVGFQQAPIVLRDSHKYP